MNREQFVMELQEALEFEETLTLQTNLKETEEWDSMAVMVLIAFVADNFEVELTTVNIEKMTTIESLIDQIGLDKFLS